MNLLPGLRDVRTPLTVGFIYVFTGWLWLGESIPARQDASGALKSIYDLYDLTGKPALLAAVSLVAYITGSLATALTAWISFWATSFRNVTLKFEISNIARVDLACHVFSNVYDVPFGFIRHSGRDRDDDPHLSKIRMAAYKAVEGGEAINEGKLYAQIERSMAYEESQLRVKLLVSNPEIHSEHDRHRAESEFRTGIAVSSAILFASLAVMNSPQWILGVFISAACLRASRSKRREANDVIVQAVIAGELVPSLIYEAVEEWRDVFRPHTTTDAG